LQATVSYGLVRRRLRQRGYPASARPPSGARRNAPRSDTWRNCWITRRRLGHGALRTVHSFATALAFAHGYSLGPPRGRPVYRTQAAALAQRGRVHANAGIFFSGVVWHVRGNLGDQHGHGGTPPSTRVRTGGLGTGLGRPT